MAISRFSVKVGQNAKKEKTSAIKHCQYVMGEGQYKKKKDEILYTNCNMPHWAKNDKGEISPDVFWKIAEENERANANIYREHIISLPRELTLEQNIAFIDDWIAKEFKGQHYYNYAIHNPKARDGKDQPHCHLMYCERIIDEYERTPKQFFKRYNPKDPKKGGAKKANTGLKKEEMKNELKEQRQRYGELLEQHLLLAGHNIKIDMRNWEERGLSEPPINQSFDEIQMEKSQPPIEHNQLYKQINKLDKEYEHKKEQERLENERRIKAEQLRLQKEKEQEQELEHQRQLQLQREQEALEHQRQLQLQREQEEMKYKAKAKELLNNQIKLVNGRRNGLNKFELWELNNNSYKIHNSLNQQERQELNQYIATTQDIDIQNAKNRLLADCEKERLWSWDNSIHNQSFPFGLSYPNPNERSQISNYGDEYNIKQKFNAVQATLLGDDWRQQTIPKEFKAEYEQTLNQEREQEQTYQLKR